MNDSARSVVHISDLTVRYGDYVALDSITFDLRAGEIVSIVGPNGGGKTTLLKVMLGFKKWDSGSVTILGRTPGDTPPGAIGYLPQLDGSRTLFPIRVRDVVLMGRTSRMGIPAFARPEDRSAVDTALRDMHITDLGDAPFRSLSGGQRQRVLIARALAMEPEILILDEPSTGLDMVSQEDFYGILQHLKTERGMAILMVSHDIGVVSRHVDRIACLNRQIHYHGPGDQLPEKVFEETFGRNVQVLVHNPDCITCKESRHEH